MAKKIREVMMSEPISVPATVSVQDAAARMREAGIGDVIVMEGSQICGIVTDRDLVVRAIAQERDPHSTTVADVCSRDLAIVSPEDQIGSAIRVMRDKAIRRLPVVEAGGWSASCPSGTWPSSETGNPSWPPSAPRARTTEA
jgi:signal-transduction protein with cAMP-binding, CBS, and nucleotidyltransferase domain